MPPRPGPPVHAAPSLVGLPAGAPQERRGRHRTGRRALCPPRPLLGAPRAPRCSLPASPLAGAAARPAAPALAASPVRPPARSLCAAPAALPASPARRPPAPSAPPPPRPLPAAGPCAAALSLAGLFLPSPRPPLSPAEDHPASASSRSRQDHGGGGALPACPLARPHLPPAESRELRHRDVKAR